MALKAIDYTSDPPSLKILDQLVLPHNMVYIPIPDCAAAHGAIKSMKVRGAPAIALVAILALAVELETFEGSDVAGWIHEKLAYLVTSRPTAVNLHDAAEKLKRVVREAPERYVRGSYKVAVERMLREDVRDNVEIGRHGAEYILRRQQQQQRVVEENHRLAVLTICNTGSLATAGYGTAYSVVSKLHALKRLERAYFCETRPYNQGARLTSTELLYDGIPSTMVLDSSIAALLSGAKNGRKDGIAAIVVGADRVARNGDTANKIGTFQLAILAKQFGIDFLVAAPWTTIDLDTPSGDEIKIEERPASEVRRVQGAVLNQDGTVVRNDDGIVQRGFVEVCGDDVDVWNPAFDVTPHEFISGIVTERGVLVKNEAGQFDLVMEKNRLAPTTASSDEKLSTVTTSNEEHQ